MSDPAMEDRIERARMMRNMPECTREILIAHGVNAGVVIDARSRFLDRRVLVLDDPITAA